MLAVKENIYYPTTMLSNCISMSKTTNRTPADEKDYEIMVDPNILIDDIDAGGTYEFDVHGAPGKTEAVESIIDMINTQTELTVSKKSLSVLDNNWCHNPDDGYPGSRAVTVQL
jgi:hypothetical protein